MTYPKRINTPQWECSDGQTFDSPDQAQEWERLVPLVNIIYRNVDSMNIQEAETLARIILTHYALFPRAKQGDLIP